MSKITLSNVSDLTNSTTAQNTINSNAATVQSAFDNTLSRDGTFPNTMGASLDMNSFQIVNLPSPTSLSSPARLSDVQGLVAGGSITLSPLPAGGTQNQILMKNSSTNYDASWLSNINISGTIITTGTTRNVISSGGALAGNLCVGSDFAGAQPCVFNILDNQAAATSRAMYFGFDDLTRPVNGSWYSVAINNVANGGFAITAGGALGVWSSVVDIGIDNTAAPTNNSTGHWITHTVQKGTGAGAIGLLCQAFAKAGYTPHGASANSGVVGAQLNGWSDVGGFTFGTVVGAITTADSGSYTNALVGLEVDCDLRYNTNGSQIGIQVVSQDGTSVGSRTVAGDNCSFTCLKSSGGGFKNAYQVGNQAGTSFPLLSTGAILKCYSSNTITDGVELSSLTFTGNAFKSPGFAIDGSGTPNFLSATAVPAGGTAGKGIKLSSVSNLGVFFGSGVPALAAAQGSLYIRTDGSSTSTRMYINTTGSTTWTNVTTAA